LRLTASEKKAERERGNDILTQSRSETLLPPLPPLPMREDAAVPSASAVPSAASGQQTSASADAPSQGRVIVPPLPAAVPPLPGAGAEPSAQNAAAPARDGDENNNIVPGQFVFNDILDEGVKLLSKFKHGATGEDMTGPGTRARRAAVNVICVARCPLGGHFTTGSDDGICRVWEDSEENGVAIVDRRFGGNFFSQEDARSSKRKVRSLRSGE
jgi:hypothetical protein